MAAAASGNLTNPMISAANGDYDTLAKRYGCNINGNDVQKATQLIQCIHNILRRHGWSCSPLGRSTPSSSLPPASAPAPAAPTLQNHREQYDRELNEDLRPSLSNNPISRDQVKETLKLALNIKSSMPGGIGNIRQKRKKGPQVKITRSLRQNIHKLSNNRKRVNNNEFSDQVKGIVKRLKQYGGAKQERKNELLKMIKASKKVMKLSKDEKKIKQIKRKLGKIVEKARMKSDRDIKRAMRMLG